MSDLEGTSLGDYQLLQCRSKGGIAAVYQARTPGSEHVYAVKVFHHGYAQLTTSRAFFLSEAAKIAQCRHPHILPLLAYGEDKGLLYTVAPYIETGTLAGLLQRVGGHLSALQALPAMQQLCEAVQYAHDCGLLHGSIKPENVFVTAHGKILLADFGILRGYDDSQESLTRVGWGSAEYVAPEQSLGILRRTSDVYALGVLLFHMLTGCPPFTGQTPVEVLLKHVRQPPPAARSLVATISVAVDEVVQKALQKRIDDRFPSARALSEAFCRAVTVAPIASPVAPTIHLPHGPVQQPFAYVMQPPETLVPELARSHTENNVAITSASSKAISVASIASEQPGLLSSNVHRDEIKKISATSIPVPARTREQLAARKTVSSELVEWSPLHFAAARNFFEEPVEEKASAILPPAYPVANTLTVKPEAASNLLWERWLPIVVVALLLLGLLGALLTAFVFSPN